MSETGSLSAPRMRDAREVDIEGVPTTYYDAGEGETIFFVFGGHFGGADAGGSAHVWDLNFVPLASRYRVIALDKLGQGFTGNPLRDEDYTMAATVRHAGALMEHLGLRDVHLVGHSRGGFAATRLALDYPERVRSLSLVSSGTSSPLISTNEITLSGSPHPMYTRESARFVYEGYTHDPRSVTEDWIDRSMEVSMHPRVPEAMGKMYVQGLYYQNFIPQLARMKLEMHYWLSEGRLQRPLQIFWGLNDRTALVEGAFELHDMVSRHQPVDIHLFNHCGHYPYREHPSRFNQLLARFVDRVSAGAQVQYV